MPPLVPRKRLYNRGSSLAGALTRASGRASQVFPPVEPVVGKPPLTADEVGREIDEIRGLFYHALHRLEILSGEIHARNGNDDVPF